MVIAPTVQDVLPLTGFVQREKVRPATEPLVMQRPKLSLADPVIAQRFAEEDRRLTLKNIRVLCCIAMALVPFATVLDQFAYPELYSDFLVLRLQCVFCLLPVMGASYTPWGQKHYRALTVLVPMIPAVFISLMIRTTGDPASGYYAGLTLCLVALALMFHWTFEESLVAVSLVLLMYVLAVMEPLRGGVKPSQLGDFINNCVFILLNSVVIVSASFYHRNIRISEFLTRMEVEKQGEALLAQNTELTDTLKQLRDTENQLVQSEKLASLGRMSAGIIHEINNPLSYAKQALFVLKKRMNDLPENRKESALGIIADVNDGIGRVSSIISDLRSFSHPDVGQYAEVQPAAMVGNALRMMSGQLSEAGVNVEFALDESLMVMGDANQIIQILINLIQNAIDATKEREAPSISIRMQHLGRSTQLVIRDNGQGIPHENLPKVFDPFFTTKDVGEGMGMGLSICFRLMQQMKGTIEASSHPGHWTEVCLTFPPVEDRAMEGQA
jgi:two-component system, sensor histidine kinase PhcS